MRQLQVVVQEEVVQHQVEVETQEVIQVVVGPVDMRVVELIDQAT